MKGPFNKRKKNSVFLSFLENNKKIFLIGITALVLISAMLFFYFKIKPKMIMLESEKMDEIVKQVAVDDSKIIVSKDETLSEDLRLLGKSVDGLEDRYRIAIVDAWVRYEREPDNFFLIGELRSSFSKMNVPFMYQTFHSNLLEVLDKKEKALLTGDIYLLQKAEHDITFLESSSFL